MSSSLVLSLLGNDSIPVTIMLNNHISCNNLCDAKLHYYLFILILLGFNSNVHTSAKDNEYNYIRKSFFPLISFIDYVNDCNGSKAKISLCGSQNSQC